MSQKSIILLLLVLLLISINCQCLEYGHVHIETEEFSGTIVGLEMQNWLDNKFFAFRGIPYAKPPIQSLRFKDPQKLDKFKGKLEAFYDSYECPSITARNQSEDCLYLNVYTPNLTSSAHLPVVVVIHPGGLYLFSSASYLLKPNNWLSKNIVLVTFNYRMGSLGFLNLGTEQIPGNAGFKDQVFALRWIQNNIKYFGGNPNDITLMGYSAGALSVSIHLVSPMSKDLFNKAIIMSGGVPPQVQLPIHEQRYLAVRQANRLKCSENVQNDDKELLLCLDQFSGTEIAKTLREMFEFGKDNPAYLWLPIVEKKFQQETFLNRDFYKTLNETLYESENNFKIPVLIGYTSGEFCNSAAGILQNTEYLKRLKKEYRQLFPTMFLYKNNISQFKLNEITEHLIKHYFSHDIENLDSNDYDNLCDLFSDSFVRFGSHRLADILSSSTDVYFYEFDFIESDYKNSESFPNKKKRVEHIKDFEYLFNDTSRSLLSTESLKLIDLYTEFLYDFIQKGKFTNLLAKPYPQNYALIRDRITYPVGINFPNYSFWKKLFL